MTLRLRDSFQMRDRDVFLGNKQLSPTNMASRNRKSFHLFHCDRLCNLSEVETLLRAVEKKVAFKILKIVPHLFKREKISDVVKTIPSLSMDFAVFVVHASESCLAFNEDSGYGKLYDSLKRRAGSGTSYVYFQMSLDFVLMVSFPLSVSIQSLLHSVHGSSFPGNSYSVHLYRLKSKLIQNGKNLFTISNAFLSCNSFKNSEAKVCY